MEGHREEMYWWKIFWGETQVIKEDSRGILRGDSRNTKQKSAEADKKKSMIMLPMEFWKKQGCHSLSRDHWEDHDTYMENHSLGLWGTDRMIWRVHSLYTWSISLECMMIGMVTMSTYTVHYWRTTCTHAWRWVDAWSTINPHIPIQVCAFVRDVLLLKKQPHP